MKNDNIYYDENGFDNQGVEYEEPSFEINTNKNGVSNGNVAKDFAKGFRKGGSGNPALGQRGMKANSMPGKTDSGDIPKKKSDGSDLNNKNNPAKGQNTNNKNNNNSQDNSNKLPGARKGNNVPNKGNPGNQGNKHGNKKGGLADKLGNKNGKNGMMSKVGPAARAATGKAAGKSALSQAAGEGFKKVFMMLPPHFKIVAIVGVVLLPIFLILAFFLISLLTGTTAVVVAATCGANSGGSSYNGADYEGSADVSEFLCRMQKPTFGYSLTSKYGYRICPYHGPETHSGVDLADSSGTPIYAVQSGVVITATSHSSYGNYIIVNHGDVIHTLYAHLSSIKVNKGDKVGKGQLIGLMGSTGNSTGPHLHFEVRTASNNQHQNTNPYFTDYNNFKTNCGSSWEGDPSGDSANAENDMDSEYVSTSSSSSNMRCCSSSGSSSSSSGDYCKNGITVEGVGTLSIDEYVAGVVSAENAYKNSSDPDNIETMKAQAIAARTYAVNSTHNCTKSIGNSQASQVYKEPGERAKRAASETAGVVMTYNGDVFSAQYDAFCMGDSDCPGASCSGKTCTATYTKVPSNKTHKITVKYPHSVNIYSGGYNGMGHAHGMSQLVARQMQDEGKKYNEILEYFYADGIEITGVSNRCMGTFDGEIIYYDQTDYPNYKFCSGSDTIANSGCGATAMAIVTSSLLGREVTPVDMRDLCCKWNLCGGDGTSWSFFEKAGTEYGLTVKNISRENADEVLNALKGKQGLVVAHMGPGHFTNGGHYITLTGYKDGKVFVHDPGNGDEDGNNKYWNFDTIVNETSSKNSNPFWIVSK